MSKNPFRLTKLTDIKPYERNPRVISQAAVDAVAKSIQAFGFRQPIVVDKDGIILAGHTRYKAACQLGLAEVPVVWASDITDLQAKGYRIADNKTAELSAWDRDGLDAEIKELAGTEIDLNALGVSDWELERILQEPEPEPSGLPLDEAPSSPAAPANINAPTTEEAPPAVSAVQPGFNLAELPPLDVVRTLVVRYTPEMADRLAKCFDISEDVLKSGVLELSELWD